MLILYILLPTPAFPARHSRISYYLVPVRRRRRSLPGILEFRLYRINTGLKVATGSGGSNQAWPSSNSESESAS